MRPTLIETQELLTRGEAFCDVHGWLYGVPHWDTGRNARDRLTRAAKRHAATCPGNITIRLEKQQTLNVVTGATLETGS